MRAAIISSTTIAKYKRWDAGFYLGKSQGQDDIQRLKNARKMLKLAKKAVVNARAEANKNRNRIRRMVADGEVKPINGH